MRLTRSICAFALALPTAAAPYAAAWAQDYPLKPIRVVVPVAPAGSPDVLARLLADRLRDRWGQPVVIENRAGAGQMIGAELVAKAAPDGYTVFLPTGTYTTSVAIRSSLPFDPARDLTGVAMVGQGPLMLVVHPSLPARNVRELVKLAKARPGQIHYATAGTGSIIHFATEALAADAGIDIVHVPYKSASPAVTDLVGGHVQMMVVSLPSVWPQVKAGRLRALALSSLKPSSFAPEIPVIADTVPGFDAGQWWGVLAPGKTPPDIVRKLNGELNRILASEDMRPRLADQGAEPRLMTPEAFTDFIRVEIDKWRKIAQARNIKP
ncbi:MAG: tripartite tricarboxylate transporter substrate binding protein [Pseudomonadota bacterium]|jgi:tripartite-type tricarboxylate transporter receptor subunit TctC